MSKIESNDSVEKLEAEIADLKKQLDTHKRFIQNHEFLDQIIKLFIDYPLNRAIDETLAKLGEYDNADRAYILRFHDNQAKFTNTHEWCANGIQPFKDQLQDLSIDHFGGGFFDILAKGHVANIPVVSQMPEEYAGFQKELIREGIVSILNIPMVYQGEVIGSLGFDIVKAERVWTDEHIKFYKLIAGLMAMALARYKSDE